MELTSPAFAAGDALPRRYTCDGPDLSPPLSWAAISVGAQSLALVLEEPGASFRPVTHWLAWGIDPACRGLGEGEPAPTGGRNDFGAPGYRGPCPPRDAQERRYVFRLLALSEELDLAAGAERRAFDRALGRRVLEEARLPVVLAR